MNKVFITGISGLVGTHLANALAGTACHVCGITRNPEKYTGIRAPNIELVAADLWDDYGPYLAGADTVVHLAGETATNLARPADYDRLNFEATVRLFELAKAHGAKQFVFASTGNTIGYGDLDRPGTEQCAMKAPFALLGYAQSKLKAENYLLAHSQGIKVTILNPTLIIGAHGGKPSSGRILLMSLGKRVVFYPPGGKNFVGVQDVVQAIRHACAAGASGERYLVAGENMSYRAFFKLLNQITGQKQWLVRVPTPVFTVLGLMGDIIRAMGIKTNLSSPNMRVLSEHTYYSNQKSVDELGVEYAPLKEALAEAVREMGY